MAPQTSGQRLATIGAFFFVLICLDPPRPTRLLSIIRKRNGSLETSFYHEPVIWSPFEINGYMSTAAPVDACSKLTNPPRSDRDPNNKILLMSSGGCGFEMKMLQAGRAGFYAVLIYNEKVNSSRPSLTIPEMRLEDFGVLHASFLSNADGEELKDKFSYPEKVRYFVRINDRDTAFILWWWSFIPLLPSTDNFLIILQIIFYWVFLYFISCFIAPVREPHLRPPSRASDEEYDSGLSDHGGGGGLSTIPSVPNAQMGNLPKFDQESCSICLEEMKPETEQVAILSCGHCYHSDCIQSWLSNYANYCPICMRKIVKTSIISSWNEIRYQEGSNESNTGTANDNPTSPPEPVNNQQPVNNNGNTLREVSSQS